jgi:hypothetical protein
MIAQHPATFTPIKTKNSQPWETRQELFGSHPSSKHSDHQKGANGSLSSRLPAQTAPPVIRKNFKEALMERKSSGGGQGWGETKSVTQLSPASRRNFKEQLVDKLSKEKQKKEEKLSFYRLEGSLMRELHQPAPSALERGHYHEVEIHHRVVDPSKVILLQERGEEDSNIQIHDEAFEFHSLKSQAPSSPEAEEQKRELLQLSEAIRKTFEKRSPVKNKRHSNSIYTMQTPSPHTEQSFDSYILESVRQNFQHLQEQAAPKSTLQ